MIMAVLHDNATPGDEEILGWSKELNTINATSLHTPGMLVVYRVERNQETSSTQSVSIEEKNLNTVHKLP